MTSFFPHTVKTWNLIGEDFRSLDSLSKFKSSLLSLIRPPKKGTYGIHNPTCIRYLFRLRLGLSSLKRHKYLHNFLDTSNDTCDCLQAPEDCFHFLFKCSLFRHLRGNFLHDVYVILRKYDLTDQAENVDIYLYGHHIINFEDSREILNAKIKYICNSGRFTC